MSKRASFSSLAGSLMLVSALFAGSGSSDAQQIGSAGEGRGLAQVDCAMASIETIIPAISPRLLSTTSPTSRHDGPRADNRLANLPSLHAESCSQGSRRRESCSLHTEPETNLRIGTTCQSRDAYRQWCAKPNAEAEVSSTKVDNYRLRSSSFPAKISGRCSDERR